MRRNGSRRSSPRSRGLSCCFPARPARRKSCPTPAHLDKAYCDRNGDLTADLPTRPKKVIIHRR